MRYATITIATCLVVLGLLLVVVLRAPAAGGSPSPSPTASPSVEPTATPTPAPAYVVHRALRARAGAVAALQDYRHALACFERHTHLRLAKRPARVASELVWTNAWRRWSEQGREWRGKFKVLHHRMTHPGGSSNGVRWKPLSRYVGWPEYTLSQLTYIIMRESSGRVRAVNPSSGCAGLLQFQPAWFHGQWGYPAFDPFDPEENLRAGVHIWREQGWQPWAL